MSTTSRRNLEALRVLRARQQQDRAELAGLDAWDESDPAALRTTLTRWLTRVIDEKESLLDYVEQVMEAGGSPADAPANVLQAERDARLAEALAREEQLIDDVEALAKALREARARIAALEGTAAASPPPVVAEAEVAPPARTDGGRAGSTPSAEAVSAVFVRWCNRGGVLVGRYFMFERYLQQTMPGVRVEVLYRDRTEMAPSFERHAEGPEYWLIRLGTVDYLWPHPVSEDQFRELAPIFDGEAVPKRIQALTPARLRVEGPLLLLDRPGSVH